MKGLERWVAFAAIMLSVVTAAGCSTGSGDSTTSGDGAEGGSQAKAAAAHAKAKRAWKIQLEQPGGKTDLALDRMDVFLVEEDDTYPEIFQILGPDAELVGEFPMSVHVGYDGYDKLIGRIIEIRASGGDPRDPKTSWVRMGEAQVPVTGGTLKVERLTGKWDGSEGDRTYWGTLELRVSSKAGEKTLRGKFAVQCVTWG